MHTTLRTLKKRKETKKIYLIPKWNTKQKIENKCLFQTTKGEVFFIIRISIHLSCPCFLLSPVCLARIVCQVHTQKVEAWQTRRAVANLHQVSSGSINFVITVPCRWLPFLSSIHSSRSWWLLRNPTPFKEFEGPWQPTTALGHGHEGSEFTSRHYILLFWDTLTLIAPSTPRPSKWSRTFRFCNYRFCKNFYRSAKRRVGKEEGWWGVVTL